MLLNFQKVSIMCLCLLSLRGCGDGSDIKNRGLAEMQLRSSMFKYIIRHISQDIYFKSASHLKRSVGTKSITETYMLVYSLQFTVLLKYILNSLSMLIVDLFTRLKQN